MSKKTIMRLVARIATVPSVSGNDLVSVGGKVDDIGDVTSWLLDKLQDLHNQARDLINDHLARLPYNGQRPL